MTLKHSYHSDMVMGRRHILLSNYSPQHSLDDQDGLSTRQPLTDSAGNSQAQSFPGLDAYHEPKSRHRYPVPTLPSQTPCQPPRNPLQLRRQSTRRSRFRRFSKNPIVDSPQYQAYRARQSQDGKAEDQKWPEVLELAFLDALMYIPIMGRRKFSFNGKPHGRNELIKEYIWLAYCQSLSPGQVPDPLMARSRKQISSHIQVLKGFMKSHPAFDRLFPQKNGSKNGFEDNFKSDPTLRALSEGRLPTITQYQYADISRAIMSNHTPIRPALFWIKMTSSQVPSDLSDRSRAEAELHTNAGLLAHKYTELCDQGHRASLESIVDWRLRFPYLAQVYANGQLDCDIIHMDVALELTANHAPEGSDLIGRITMSMPGRELSDCAWQSVTTLIRPPELLRGPNFDPPLDAVPVPTEVLAVSDTQTQIKVPFPANAWAHTFTSLTNVQLGQDERKTRGYGKLGLDNPTASVRQYVEQISMYQELESRSGPGMPYIRRAVIVWTFRKARSGEAGNTIWRYLDPPPPRQTCMSPPPPLDHHDLASMNENFHTWGGTSLQLHQPNLLDPFVQGLATPPHMGGLQSPFHIPSYNYHTSHFDIPQENLSFISNKTLDSESTTLVDHEATSAHIDHLLSTTNVSVNLEYDDHTPTNWHLPTSESFDSDSAWANYTVPSSTPQIEWNPEVTKHKDNDPNTWPDMPESKAETSDSWTDEGHQTKHEWEDNDNTSNSEKNTQSLLEQTLEQKVAPWIGRASDSEVVKDHVEVGEGSTGILEMDVVEEAIVDFTKEAQGWVVVEGGFEDYEHLVS